MLGHHYQRDEVIQFADVTGDSFKLARDAAARPDAEYIVFCGVHFMAESADILTSPDQKVILPDLAAGCSMADMARLAQVEDAWDALVDAGIADSVVPVTYMNSSADIKAFCGRNGGAVCTSSNAQVALEWAFEQKPDVEGEQGALPPRPAPRPQHRGAADGVTLDDCVVWDPHRPNGGLTAEQLRDAKMILWRGHCSVHGRFTAEVRRRAARADPRRAVLVHPECKHEVVTKADLVGSTEFIIKTIEAAPAGSSWAIGTELNLVQRLADAHPDKNIVFLDKTVCYCSTMNRIDLPHLVWALENLVAGHVVNLSRSTPRPSTGPRSRCSGCSTCRPARPPRTDRRVRDARLRSRLNQRIGSEAGGAPDGHPALSVGLDRQVVRHQVAHLHLEQVVAPLPLPGFGAKG